MPFAGINYLAVVLAALVGFIFGAVYYALLARRWRRALGKSAAEVKEGLTPATFVIAAAAQLVMAFVLAGLVGHFGAGDETVFDGLIIGAGVWLGFVLTAIAVSYGYQGARTALTVIDSGHWLGVLLLQGSIVGGIGV